MKTDAPHEISSRGAKVWPVSVPAYRALGHAGPIPKNTELLYGVVYQKMSKSPIHSTLVRRLLKRRRGVPLGGCFATSEQPLTCKDSDSEPEPDVAVVRGSEDDFWEEHPRTAELVIEVCVSIRDYDRSKLRAYARAAVKEVWPVLVPVCRKETDDAGRIICGALPQFELDLEGFFEK